jgi:hypothetical protein
MTIAEQLKHDFSKGSLELYNSNGRLIYDEDSNGYWYKYEYDSTGNVTYYGDSNGYWSKREYDSNGNRSYFEDSTGSIEDNRPKTKCEGKTVVVDGVEYELKEKK